MNNYMSKNELAESLGVSLASINRRMEEIPHIKMGGHRQSRILFDPGNVKEYLKKFEVNPRMNKKDSERDLSWAQNFWPYHDKKGEIVFLNEVNPNDKHDQQKWGRVEF
jgi:hypothetical protein